MALRTLGVVATGVFLVLAYRDRYVWAVPFALYPAVALLVSTSRAARARAVVKALKRNPFAGEPETYTLGPDGLEVQADGRLHRLAWHRCTEAVVLDGGVVFTFAEEFADVPAAALDGADPDEVIDAVRGWVEQASRRRGSAPIDWDVRLAVEQADPAPEGK